MCRVVGHIAAARQIERIDDRVHRLAAQFIEDHVGAGEAADLKHSGIRGLDRLLGDLDPILPLFSWRSDRRQLVDAA